MDLRIDELAERCDELNGDMEFHYVSISPSIEFSNTGRRGGKKYFSISLVDLIQTLKDIKNNLTEFEDASPYDEGKMRNLFSSYITSKTINALSTVQTLPLYGVIAKVIYFTNEMADDFSEKTILFDNHCFEIAIGYLESQLPNNSDYLKNLSIKNCVQVNEYQASNTIFYGAPGTGKSYAIDEIVKESKHVSTVFHPDTQYSDFVGCLKPSMNGSDVEYRFREGPFCKVLKVAHENPLEHCYLVIEEINRASAAAVFGEIFQLLDREPNGGSRYSVDINDPDMLSYLALNAQSVIIDGQLKLPSNLSIYATMNSSDQAVMPMDTAFKRRWKFEYKSINFDKCANGSFTILDSESLPFTISWKKFAGCINECLAMQEIPEDRHLGPWFLSSEELQDEKCASYALTGKLFMYLWDDVLRHGLKTTVFDSNIKNYGQLVHSFNSGVSVFSETLLDRFQEAISVSMSLVAEPTSEYTVSKNSQEE